MSRDQSGLFEGSDFIAKRKVSGRSAMVRQVQDGGSGKQKERMQVRQEVR